MEDRDYIKNLDAITIIDTTCSMTALHEKGLYLNKEILHKKYSRCIALVSMKQLILVLMKLSWPSEAECSASHADIHIRLSHKNNYYMH